MPFLLARTTTTPEASTGQWVILVTLEADQAVQEASFAGACQDQHAGRPAPSLGWPGENQSCMKGNQAPARVPGLGGTPERLPNSVCHLFFVILKKSPGGRQAKGWETAETAAAEVGAWREAGTGYPPYPPALALPPRVSKL